MRDQKELRSRARRLRRGLSLWALWALLGLSACGSSGIDEFRNFPPLPQPRPYSSPEAIKQFDATPDEPYRLGEGDGVSVLVWERPDLSGPHVVGPDGVITLPVIGSQRVAGLTRDETAKLLKDAFSRLYTGIGVTLRVDTYGSNQVVVAGRVKNPGAIKFEGVPTLLNAISRAGGLLEGTVNLTHCAVVRGRDRIAWIDIRNLIDGQDLSGNLRLKAGDLVLVPEDGDLPVYVMGQVMKPGPYRWRKEMTFVEALAMAGGCTRDSFHPSILLVRPSKNLRIDISQGDAVAQSEFNVQMERGDIIYVSTNILADFGYVIEKLNPWSWIFIVRPTGSLR